MVSTQRSTSPSRCRRRCACAWDRFWIRPRDLWLFLWCKRRSNPLAGIVIIHISLYSPLLEFLLTSQYFHQDARPHKSFISDWWIQINCYWQAIRTVNQKLWVVLCRTRWYRMKPCPSRLPHGTLYSLLGDPGKAVPLEAIRGKPEPKSTTSCKRMV